jgi:hypothetical protein
VKHSANEYVRYEGDKVIHTNTIENAFSVFKRGMICVYQHCGGAHLHRYFVEFDFRYNRRAALKVSNTERAEQLLEAARGKRLTYRRTNEVRSRLSRKHADCFASGRKRPCELRESGCSRLVPAAQVMPQ